MKFMKQLELPEKFNTILFTIKINRPKLVNMCRY